jgi:hypothetical protein
MQYKKVPYAQISRSFTSTTKTEKAVDAKRLLLSWVNLSDHANAVERLWRLHRDQIRPIAGKHGEQIIADVKRLLRWAWHASDPRHRDWFLGLARIRYQQGCVAAANFFDAGLDFAQKTFPGPPDGAASLFDYAVFYAQTKLAQKMQCCKADCVSPYFFRRRKGQDYCCTECRDRVRDAANREWWARNGRRWRAERRKK